MPETGATAYPVRALMKALSMAMLDAVSQKKVARTWWSYNPSARARGPITELGREAVRSRSGDCMAASLCSEGAELMLKRGAARSCSLVHRLA